MKNLGLHSHG